MGAQYINYITLGLALEIFSKYGKAQMLHADKLLKVRARTLHCWNYVVQISFRTGSTSLGRARDSIHHGLFVVQVGLTKILQTRGCMPDREFSIDGGTPRSMNLIKVRYSVCKM